MRWCGLRHASLTLLSISACFQPGVPIDVPDSEGGATASASNAEGVESSSGRPISGGGTLGTGAEGSTGGSTGLAETTGGQTSTEGASASAVDDAYLLDQGLPSLVVEAPGLLANDVASGGRTLEVVSVGVVETDRGGHVLLSADGGIAYQPPPSLWGEDGFEYEIRSEENEPLVGHVRLVIRPVHLELGSIANRAGGYALDGTWAGGEAGEEMAGAGDFDGDGLPDLVTSASRTGPSYGAGYVVFGGTDPMTTSLGSLASNGDGLVISSIGNTQYIAVAGVGDIDGDGFDDVLIGSDDTEFMGSDGAGYLIPGGQSSNGNIWTMNDREFYGGHDEYAGLAVGGLGDVNGDGTPDLALSAPYADVGETDTGRVYVAFGGGDVEYLPQIASGIGGFVVDGEPVANHRVTWVDGAGDIDGDGLGDIIVGAHLADSPLVDAGRAYVLYGKADGLPVSSNDLLVGLGGFALTGPQTGAWAGHAVAGIGDVNGDGVPDLAVGAPRHDIGGLSNAGRVYVVYGSWNPTDLPALSAGAEGGYVVDGAYGGGMLGWRVDGCGDLNGDGIGDLLIGAHGAGPGRAYVVYGDPLATSLSLSSLTPDRGFMIEGEHGGDAAGRSIACIGDMDGDGLAEIAVGAPGFDGPAGVDAGRVYVVRGTPSVL